MIGALSHRARDSNALEYIKCMEVVLIVSGKCFCNVVAFVRTNVLLIVR